MTRLDITRRGLLKSLGLTAAAATPVFRRGILQAQSGAKTRPKFVGVFSFAGFLKDYWVPASNADFTSGALPALLEPFAPVRSKLWQLGGVGMTVIPGQGTHNVGYGSMLTGWLPLKPYSLSPQGASIDQYVAQNRDQDMPLPSLETGVKPKGSLSAVAKNQPATAIGDPAAAFARAFAGFTPDGGGQPTGPDPAVLRAVAERRSILDFAAREINASKQYLGRADRDRLDIHLDSISSIENRLSNLTTGGGGGPIEGCGGLHMTADSATSGQGGGSWYTDDNNVPTVMQLQMDIIAAALACGRTNLATMTGGGDGAWSVPFLGYDYAHHKLSHWKSVEGVDSNTAKEMYRECLAWMTDIVGGFAAKLDGIQEADGSTLLDNTLIMWGSDCGNAPGHNPKNIPWLMAGSGGGYFKTGKHIDLGAGRSHCDLLVEISHAMGTPTNSYGDPAHNQGRMPEVVA